MAKPAEVGRLNVELYGTRDAAKGWHNTIDALGKLRVPKAKGSSIDLPPQN